MWDRSEHEMVASCSANALVSRSVRDLTHRTM